MSTPDVEHEELSTEAELTARRATCKRLIHLMANRVLIPFLGAGVNLTNRPEEAVYVPEGPYLPNGGELSESIARECDYPWEDQSLLRVSWYASYAMQDDAVLYGKDLLYQHLHRIFSREDYELTDVHTFFARLPKRLRNKGYPNRNQIIVTTNYDELLERAFDAEGEPYDVISYVEHRGGEIPGFRLTSHEGESKSVYTNDDVTPSPDRTLILKIHGAVDRKFWRRSSFVITEDDYIDYVALRIPDQIPATLLDEILSRRFLFLGYSLSDWNLRVLLRSIRARSSFNLPTWAVMNQHKEWDPMYWRRHGVRLEKCSLKEYMATLNEQLDGFPNGPGT
jgi:hypothetical protein